MPPHAPGQEHKLPSPTSPSHSPDEPESPSSPSLPEPEKWLSPLDRIQEVAAQRRHDDDHVVQAARLSEEHHDHDHDHDHDHRRPSLAKMDEHGVRLGSMAVYHPVGRDQWSPRMPFHGREYDPASPQPGTPAFSEDDLNRTGVGHGESRIDLLGDGHPPGKSPGVTRGVSFAPPSPPLAYPPPRVKRAASSWPSEPASWSFKCCGGVWQWHPSFGMYLCFVFGIIFSVAHHVYYSFLEGKPALDQTWMLRYGSFLAYAAKAGFSAAVIQAYKQRVWVTVRSRFVSISALDAMFAAGEDMMAMVNLGFLKNAKGAYLLASFAWTTPFVVILTANTLLVEPRQMHYNTTCPAVRTLNFSFEETNEWRNPVQIDGLFENPVSLWNTTERDDVDDPNWFDYYTGPSPNFQQTTTLGAFLEEVVARKHASFDICGMGWNCSFVINFTAPGYQCTELASGVDSVPKNLTQESGEAVPPFGTDLLLPRGNYSYYAYTLAGEYSGQQLKNVSIGGIPRMNPPYPDHFGALRVEPLIWVGYSVLNHPWNETQPSRNDSGWDEAFTPKIFACEHRETEYVANITYIDSNQLANITSHKYGLPIINTTFLPNIDADDGTDDNITAIPESNYIYPNDTARYRRVAAYHSFGRMLRGFMNGTVMVEATLIQPIANTQAIQTKLLDQRSNYFPYSNLQERVQSLYDDLILSVLSNPQFVEVVWAAHPEEQSGTLLAGGVAGANDTDYLYNCTRFRTENVYAYHKRDLWIVYGTYAFFTLICIIAGAFAIYENGGVTRNTQFSSVVAATRGPALEKIAWMGPLQDRGDVPAEVKKLKLGYGVLNDLGAAGRMDDDRGPHVRRSTTYGSAFSTDVRCGFGMKGDVDQRHKEGSLFHK